MQNAESQNKITAFAAANAAFTQNSDTSFPTPWTKRLNYAFM
jgi:hypothetical protein